MLCSVPLEGLSCLLQSVRRLEVVMAESFSHVAMTVLACSPRTYEIDLLANNHSFNNEWTKSWPTSHQGLTPLATTCTKQLCQLVHSSFPAIWHTRMLIYCDVGCQV